MLTSMQAKPTKKSQPCLIRQKKSEGLPERYCSLMVFSMVGHLVSGASIGML